MQVCEVATTLYERSKKSLIGDGTYAGFVQSVISSVPNAAPLSGGGGYGYLSGKYGLTIGTQSLHSSHPKPPL